MLLLQPLQHADFGQAERSAATQCETDAGTLSWLSGGGFRHFFLIGLLVLRRRERAE
jgi:hypothetical protein